MLLLAISGPNGAGKSTLAYRLQKEHGVTPLAFGEELKKHCAALYPFMSVSEFGWEGSNWNGPKTDRGREILKREGEKLRLQNPNVWVSKLERQMRTEGRYCIHDVRHLCEIKWLERLSGQHFILGVENDVLPDNHPSETEWRAYVYAKRLAVDTRENLWQKLSSASTPSTNGNAAGRS